MWIDKWNQDNNTPFKLIANNLYSIWNSHILAKLKEITIDIRLDECIDVSR